VFYEPNVYQYALINASVETNKNFMKIIDIQETQSVEFCVNWASPFAWLRPPTTMATTQIYGSSVTPSAQFDTSNGYIAVVPFTSLQSPDNSDISINMYVRSEDIQYNQFIDTNMPDDRLIVTESGDLTFSGEVTCLDLNVSTATTTHICEDYFGERPVSFRSLLKRYVTTSALPISAYSTTDISTLVVLDQIIPIPDPLIGVSGRSTYVSANLFDYMRYAYLGVRGSVKKRVMYFSNVEQVELSQVRVTLNPPNSSIETPSTTSIATPVSATMMGTVTYTPASNAGVEFDLPFYSRNLFAFSFASDLVGSSNTGEMDTSWSKSYTCSNDCVLPIKDGYIIEQSAGGEDFMFFRYQGAPYYSFPV
jgi:hypothetical protein